jgi:hypothetical protein
MHNPFRKWLQLFFLLLAPVFPNENEAPKDQFSALFESTAYVLYKALDFANDHGFRYIKILSYEFTGVDHAVVGVCNYRDYKQGRFIKLKDEFLTISLLCFKEKPNDLNIIDLEKHRAMLDSIGEEMVKRP